MRTALPSRAVGNSRALLQCRGVCFFSRVLIKRLAHCVRASHSGGLVVALCLQHELGRRKQLRMRLGGEDRLYHNGVQHRAPDARGVRGDAVEHV